MRDEPCKKRSKSCSKKRMIRLLWGIQSHKVVCEETPEKKKKQVFVKEDDLYGGYTSSWKVFLIWRVQESGERSYCRFAREQKRKRKDY